MIRGIENRRTRKVWKWKSLTVVVLVSRSEDLIAVFKI